MGSTKVRPIRGFEGCAEGGSLSRKTNCRNYVASLASAPDNRAPRLRPALGNDPPILRRKRFGIRAMQVRFLILEEQVLS